MPVNDPFNEADGDALAAHINFLKGYIAACEHRNYELPFSPALLPALEKAYFHLGLYPNGTTPIRRVGYAAPDTLGAFMDEPEGRSMLLHGEADAFYTVPVYAVGR